MVHWVRFARGLVAVSVVVVSACGGVARSSHDDDPAANAGASGLAESGGSSFGSAGSVDVGGGGLDGVGGRALGDAGESALGGTGGRAMSGIGGEPDVPSLNGVPIGDCREPTESDRAALGCPKAPPADGAPCDLERGITCAYSLSTNQDSSYQDLYMCSNDVERRWWLLRDRCGMRCPGGGAHEVQLDVGNCATREEHTCTGDDVIYAYSPSGYTLMSDMLRGAIYHCAPGTGDYTVSVELTHGCAKRFSSSFDFSQSALDCIRQRLESVRYLCAEKLPCAGYSQYFL